jgi:hypothetical protein
MHIAATHKVPKAERIKLGELHVKMRNCKTPKVVEGQSVDYAAIHGAKKKSHCILQQRAHLRKEMVVLRAM